MSIAWIWMLHDANSRFDCVRVERCGPNISILKKHFDPSVEYMWNDNQEYPIFGRRAFSEVTLFV